MTYEERFDDLKQFITATVSQQTAQLEQRLDNVEQRMATKDDLTRIEQRMDGVEQRIDSIEQQMATKQDLARVEQRLDAKLDQVLDAVGDTITHVADTADVAIQKHEQHYHGRLEHRAA